MGKGWASMQRWAGPPTPLPQARVSKSSPEVPSESGRGDPVSPWQRYLARTPVQVAEGPSRLCVWTLLVVLVYSVKLGLGAIKPGGSSYAG